MYIRIYTCIYITFMYVCCNGINVYIYILYIYIYILCNVVQCNGMQWTAMGCNWHGMYR